MSFDKILTIQRGCLNTKMLSYQYKILIIKIKQTHEGVIL